jgi:large subunit ribosomal protein L1
MPVEDIVENLEAVLTRLESKLERGRLNIQSVFVKTTMGPAIRVI